MDSQCKIWFLPDDVTVSVPVGTTILSAANEVGVFINSLCGGDGVCGRCRIIVKHGKATGGSTELFTHEDIQHGYMLACEACIETDLEVEIPPETRLDETPVHAEEEVPSLADVTERARMGRKFAPLVGKIYLEMPVPTLDNNISDLQRVEQALGKKMEADRFQMGLKVTRRLPGMLRKSSWKITAITGHRGPLTEIIDVEAGDTSGRNMAVVADIGTTTVVCHLVDLRDGHTLGQAAKYNSQAGFGADVIRRIIYASQSAENETKLREAIVGDLNELIQELLSQYRIGRQDINLLSAAGNTTMVHLLLNLPSENIRREPYIGAAYHLPPFRAAEIGIRINARGLLYCLPCVAGFVGADIVAGISATGLARSSAVRMLIDIGTNGEIVIGNKDFLVCASASAGPAFEGAECAGGMRATKGAIDHIQLLNADHVLSFSTIARGIPSGICGTGYVDLIAEMLRVGVIDKTGRILPGSSKERVRAGRHGEMEYIVVPAGQTKNNQAVIISQGDINNLLRAKGAIFAASAVLLNALTMKFDDLDEILIAGAFGNFLNIHNAVFIGLLPDMPREKMRFVGNSSLAGAKLAALCTECYEEAFEIASKTTYFELSTDPTFMDQFVSACFFPHTNVELFPSVLADLAASKRRR